MIGIARACGGCGKHAVRCALNTARFSRSRIPADVELELGPRSKILQSLVLSWADAIVSPTFPLKCTLFEFLPNQSRSAADLACSCSHRENWARAKHLSELGNIKEVGYSNPLRGAPKVSPRLSCKPCFCIMESTRSSRRVELGMGTRG